MNIKKKMLSVVSAILAITIVTGCNANRNRDIDNDNSQDIVASENSENLRFNASEIDNQFRPTTLEYLKETLYDEDIDFDSIIEKYLSTKYSERESLKDDFLRALYMYLINTDIPLELYLEELNTLLVEHQLPRCLDNVTWNRCFGNLIKAQKDYSSLVEMYIDLAIYVHEYECKEEHTLNELDSYSCIVLEREFKG